MKTQESKVWDVHWDIVLIRVLWSDHKETAIYSVLYNIFIIFTGNHGDRTGSNGFKLQEGNVG